MKVLVTGVGGQLGHDVMNELNKRGHTPIGTDIAGNCDFILDITKSDEVDKLLNRVMPDAVIHCAAWTAVDAAEDKDKIDTVFEVNAKGTKNLANTCKEIGCKMMYISTDYVFDGQGNLPWTADCKDYAPLNVYGKSKLEGELSVASALENYFIVRIAWVFGKNGNNFVKTMLSLSKKYDSLRVVCDQIGTPTYTLDLSRLLVDMIESDKYGYYHATNEGGYISWYDFACEIFRQSRLEISVTPVTTEEYGLSKAKRPYNSRLDRSKLIKSGFLPLPDWKDALSRYLTEIEE